MHIHICAQPAANVSQMCTLISKEHLYNAYSCTSTGAQNTCSKVHLTPTAKKCTYIYIYTHMHTHRYAEEYTCTSMTLFKHAEEWLPRLKIYAQTCIRIYIHTYIHACVYPYTYTCRYTHMHVHTHTNTRIYAHTYNMYICIHASTPGTIALQRLREELMQSPKAPHVSFVQRNQPYLAAPMLGLHCTHFLRHQYPSTPHPLFPKYPRTVCGPRRARFYCSTLINTTECTTLKKFRAASQWPLAYLSLGKIGGKAAVQQSPSKRARRTPIPRMHSVTVHEKQKVN